MAEPRVCYLDGYAKACMPTRQPTGRRRGSPPSHARVDDGASLQRLRARELAAATGLGRSRIGKALVALEHAPAGRTPGGRERGRGRPDRWRTLPNAGVEDSTDGRLRRGQLRAVVAEHLRQQPEVMHTPIGVAKGLGRSAGVVSSALDRVAADGAVDRTSVTPRRFRRRR